LELGGKEKKKGGGGLLKLELGGRSKMEAPKSEEDEIKEIQRWSRKFRSILVLVSESPLARSLMRTVSSN